MPYPPSCRVSEASFAFTWRSLWFGGQRPRPRLRLAVPLTVSLTLVWPSCSPGCWSGREAQRPVTVREQRVSETYRRLVVRATDDLLVELHAVRELSANPAAIRLVEAVEGDLRQLLDALSEPWHGTTELVLFTSRNATDPSIQPPLRTTLVGEQVGRELFFGIRAKATCLHQLVSGLAEVAEDPKCMRGIIELQELTAGIVSVLRLAPPCNHPACFN